MLEREGLAFAPPLPPSPPPIQPPLPSMSAGLGPIVAAPAAGIATHREVRCKRAPPKYLLNNTGKKILAVVCTYPQDDEDMAFAGPPPRDLEDAEMKDLRDYRAAMKLLFSMAQKYCRNREMTRQFWRAYSTCYQYYVC